MPRVSDTPRARRPRPVADAPVAALIDRADALAKGWLIALVERRPLAEAAEVPAGELGREGPAIFAAYARALASDEALADFLEREARAVARLAGATDPAGVAEAVEAQRAIVWSASLDALSDPAPEQLAELSDRLAHIATRLVALSSGAASPWTRAPRAEPATSRQGPERGAREEWPARAEDARPSAEPSDTPPADGESGPFTRPLHAVPTPGEAPLWLSALEQRLGRGGRPGEKTSLLLVELDGLERLRAASEDGAADLLSRAAREIRRAVRREDLVAHEEDGRAWILATDTGRLAAEALARRIAEFVGHAASPHGAGLTASVGLAVHPEDGRDAGALAAYAEEEMLAARAAGVRVLGDSMV
jgi:GGDEF domain-containing protein